MFLSLYLSCLGPEHIQIITEDERQFSSVLIFADSIGSDLIQVSRSSDYLSSDAYHVYLHQEELPVQSYQLSKKGKDIEVLGGDILAIQYGLAHYLELQGFRFYHPYETLIPSTLSSIEDKDDFDIVHSPDMERRGIHMHTLHPIEGY